MKTKTVRMISLYKALPGAEEAMKYFLNNTIGAALKNAGCLSFEFQQNPTESYQFNFIENWSAQVTFEHVRNAHIREGLEHLGEFVTVGPDMRR